MSALFVYGSLQDTDVLKAVLGEETDLKSEAARLEGYRCCYVQDANYPNIVSKDSFEVEGLLLEGLTEQQIALLDVFEEDYGRQEVTVELQNRKVRIEAYIGTEKIDLERQFDFATWQQTQKSEFLSCLSHWQFTREWKPKPDCRLCNSKNVGAFETCKEKTGERFYWRCFDCDYVFLDETQLPSAQEERAVYDLHENSPEDAAYVDFLSQIVTPLKEHLREISPNNFTKLTGLDFGCGPGPTVSTMFSENNWDVQNYDPIFFPSPSPWEQQFDFIISTEVFEHFHEPGPTISKLWDLLKPGGLLAVMTSLRTPENSFQKWHYRRDPTHVGFFSKRTVQHLQANLKGVSIHLTTNTFIIKKLS